MKEVGSGINHMIKAAYGASFDIYFVLSWEIFFEFS